MAKRHISQSSNFLFRMVFAFCIVNTLGCSTDEYMGQNLCDGLEGFVFTYSEQMGSPIGIEYNPDLLSNPLADVIIARKVISHDSIPPIDTIRSDEHGYFSFKESDCSLNYSFNLIAKESGYNYCELLDSKKKIFLAHNRIQVNFEFTSDDPDFDINKVDAQIIRPSPSDHSENTNRFYNSVMCIHEEINIISFDCMEKLNLVIRYRYGDLEYKELSFYPSKNEETVHCLIKTN